MGVNHVFTACLSLRSESLLFRLWKTGCNYIWMVQYVLAKAELCKAIVHCYHGKIRLCISPGSLSKCSVDWLTLTVI